MRKLIAVMLFVVGVSASGFCADSQVSMTVDTKYFDVETPNVISGIQSFRVFYKSFGKQEICTVDSAVLKIDSNNYSLDSEYHSTLMNIEGDPDQFSCYDNGDSLKVAIRTISRTCDFVLKYDRKTRSSVVPTSFIGTCVINWSDNKQQVFKYQPFDGWIDMPLKGNLKLIGVQKTK